MLKRLWREDEGILTFEWILLLTVLVIGVVGGVAGIRDAIIHECQGVVGAMVSLNQSYEIVPPLGVAVHPVNWQAGGGVDAVGCTSGAAWSSFVDEGTWEANRQDLSLPTNNSATEGQVLCDLP